MHRRLWRVVTQMADRCCDDERVDENGIWEFRDGRQLLSGDIGRWIALDRALRIARRRRPWHCRSKWMIARAATAERVLAALLPDGRLPQSYDGDPNQLDASALLIVMFGMLDTTDPRARALVRTHLDALSDGPFLRRYATTVNDGFPGTDATFTPCSWWAVTALSAIGEQAEATARADELCLRLPRLLSEEFDPSTGTSLGNTPLVWAHAEMARALRVLATADRATD